MEEDKEFIKNKIFNLVLNTKGVLRIDSEQIDDAIRLSSIFSLKNKDLQLIIIYSASYITITKEGQWTHELSPIELIALLKIEEEFKLPF